MTDCVTVTTGARLHFGLLVAGQPSQRTYGGIGLMIDQPRFSLTVRAADQDEIHATPETTERIEKFVCQLRTEGEVQPWRVEVHEEIPAHAGLGSGTQLGLALATAMSRLSDDRCVAPDELARRMGRGTRSAIGTLGFQSGGLIAHGPSQSPPVRQDFPADWRFILVTPPDHQGLSGELERHAFREMPPMSDRQIESLSRWQHQLLTAAAQRDYHSFSDALLEFGRSVGEYFAPFQAGVFAHPRMAALAQTLKADGIRGVGQTSWGPTLFALCDGTVSAEAVAAQIRRSHDWSDCGVRIVAGKNSGVNIKSTRDRET